MLPTDFVTSHFSGLSPAHSIVLFWRRVGFLPFFKTSRPLLVEIWNAVQQLLKINQLTSFDANNG